MGVRADGTQIPNVVWQVEQTASCPHPLPASGPRQLDEERDGGQNLYSRRDVSKPWGGGGGEQFVLLVTARSGKLPERT